MVTSTAKNTCGPQPEFTPVASVGLTMVATMRPQTIAFGQCQASCVFGIGNNRVPRELLFGTFLCVLEAKGMIQSLLGRM